MWRGKGVCFQTSATGFLPRRDGTKRILSGAEARNLLERWLIPGLKAGASTAFRPAGSLGGRPDTFCLLHDDVDELAGDEDDAGGLLAGEEGGDFLVGEGGVAHG